MEVSPAPSSTKRVRHDHDHQLGRSTNDPPRTRVPLLVLPTDVIGVIMSCIPVDDYPSLFCVHHHMISHASQWLRHTPSLWLSPRNSIIPFIPPLYIIGRYATNLRVIRLPWHMPANTPRGDITTAVAIAAIRRIIINNRHTLRDITNLTFNDDMIDAFIGTTSLTSLRCPVKTSYDTMPLLTNIIGTSATQLRSFMLRITTPIPHVNEHHMSYLLSLLPNLTELRVNQLTSSTIHFIPDSISRHLISLTLAYRCQSNVGETQQLIGHLLTRVTWPSLQKLVISMSNDSFDPAPCAPHIWHLPETLTSLDVSTVGPTLPTIVVSSPSSCLSSIILNMANVCPYDIHTLLTSLSSSCVGQSLTKLQLQMNSERRGIADIDHRGTDVIWPPLPYLTSFIFTTRNLALATSICGGAGRSLTYIQLRWDMDVYSADHEAAMILHLLSQCQSLTCVHLAAHLSRQGMISLPLLTLSPVMVPSLTSISLSSLCQADALLPMIHAPLLNHISLIALRVNHTTFINHTLYQWPLLTNLQFTRVQVLEPFDPATISSSSSSSSMVMTTRTKTEMKLDGWTPILQTATNVTRLSATNSTHLGNITITSNCDTPNTMAMTSQGFQYHHLFNHCYYDGSDDTKRNHGGSGNDGNDNDSSVCTSTAITATVRAHNIHHLTLCACDDIIQWSMIAHMTIPPSPTLILPSSSTCNGHGHSHSHSSELREINIAMMAWDMSSLHATFRYVPLTITHMTLTWLRDANQRDMINDASWLTIISYGMHRLRHLRALYIYPPLTGRHYHMVYTMMKNHFPHITLCTRPPVLASSSAAVSAPLLPSSVTLPPLSKQNTDWLSSSSLSLDE